MNQAGVGWAVGVSLCALIACGGGSDKVNSSAAGAPADSPSGGAAGSNANGSAGSAGSLSNGGASAGSAGKAATSEFVGDLQMGWFDSGEKFTTRSGATFYVPEQPTGFTCSSEKFGACTVKTCVTSASATVMPQAGVISLSNGLLYNATLTPNADGSYPSQNDAGVLLPGEDTITISATGGDVPAFSSTITTPLTLLVTTPVPNSTGQVPWQRDTDLPIVFDRGVAGVQLVVQGGVSPGTSIACYFPSETGTATIPTAVLKPLAAGTILTLLTYQSAHVTAGKYDVLLQAFMHAMEPEKKRGIRVSLQ